MFQRPYITEQNQLQCSNHPYTIDRVSFQLNVMNTNFRLLCAECTLQKDEKIRESTLQIDHEHQFYIISLLDLSVPLFNKERQILDNNYMDFRYMEIEHIIIDDKSQGYSARNLVYCPDKNLLIACSCNGHITLWSLGEQVKWKNELNIEKTIRFAKYISRGERGTNYLILGVNNQLQIYDIKEDNLVLVTVMNCQQEAYDVDWIPQNDKIVIVGNGKIIQIWDIKSFFLEKTINIEVYGMQGPIYRIIYLSHKNSLALEDISGVSIISLGQGDPQADELPRHFHIPNRTVLGLAYLPQSQQFIVRSAEGTYLIDEHTLTCKYKYLTYMHSLRPPPDSQIIINEDESQFMSENPPGRLFVYSKEGSFDILRLYGMVKNERGALEIIKDQHRVVVGDQDSGVFYILRTNAQPTSDFKVYQISYKSENIEVVPKDKEIENEVSSERKTRSRRGNVQSKTKIDKDETSKDQVKRRGAKKEDEKGKRGNARRSKRKNRDQDMEIEEEKEEEIKEKATRKSSRSRSKKTEVDKDEKKEKKAKSKAERKHEEEKEEKLNDREKARKGKK